MLSGPPPGVYSRFEYGIIELLRERSSLMRIEAGRPKTKIVCTLGPATSTEETVRSLAKSGMSIARLNLSHGTLAEHTESLEIVRKVSADLDLPLGVMVDVPGIKYRTGPADPGVVNLSEGDEFTLTSRDVVGSESLVSISPPGIHRDAAVDSSVLLDDGLMELRVVAVQGEDVVCTVVRGGRLTEGRGVATPGRSPSQGFPNEKAIEALEFAAESRADFVALSTITGPDDIAAARLVLERKGHSPLIISKIERSDAVDDFEQILAVSDAIMVARGDMGVEVQLASVPVLQKRLISLSNHAGKPVITATQMLESMIRSSVPTRAEVTDVANAIYDGTDAIMLSGETSIGQHPVEAVKVMAEVALQAEAALPYEKMLGEKLAHLVPQTDDAISYDACRSALQLDASLIIAFTESGGTAARVSKYRPVSPILAMTPSAEVQRRLTIAWGVVPIAASRIRTVEDFFRMGEDAAVRICGAGEGDLAVLVAGLPIGVPGGTNLLRVLTISDRNVSV